MNSWGLLQETLSIHDSMNLPKNEFILHFILKIIYNFGDKTVLFLIFNPINGFIVVQNGKAQQPV